MIKFRAGFMGWILHVNG